MSDTGTEKEPTLNKVGGFIYSSLSMYAYWQKNVQGDNREELVIG